MIYQCKVFDRDGRLKKILSGSELTSKNDKVFFEQKSTKRAISYIKTMKDPLIKSNGNVKFYNKNCLVCDCMFHPRHPQSKYCSHECQKKLYLEKNNKRKMSKKNI